MILSLRSKRSILLFNFCFFYICYIHCMYMGHPQDEIENFLFQLFFLLNGLRDQMRITDQYGGVRLV